MARDKTIQRQIGKNFIDILAENLGGNVYEAFKELASNGYDADASHMSFDFKRLEDCVVITDDGDGMDADGLESFFRLGDSPKAENPVTPKGRKVIGKFGIATVLIPYLADSYTLETWKGGGKITLKEGFGKMHSTTDPIIYSVRADDEYEHGTRITLKGLRFMSNNLFSIKRLERILAWEMPNQEDFSIKIDGRTVGRETLEPTTRYRFEEDLPNAGKITAEIYYFKEGIPNPGIMVYVNGRAVGSQDYFDVTRVHGSIVNKVFGILHADVLQEHISFDRTRFQEDNSAFIEVKAFIYRSLNRVRNYADTIKGEEKTEIVRKAVPHALRRSSEAVGLRTLKYLEESAYKSGGARPASPEHQVKEMRIRSSASSSDDKSLEFRLVQGYPASAGIAFLKEDTVELNANHPYFHQVNTRLLQGHLHLQFLLAASYAIGRNLTENKFKNKSAGDLISQREAIVAELLEGVFSRDQNFIEALRSSITAGERAKEFNRHIVYNENEAVGLSGITFSTFRRLVETGALKSRTGDDFYLGIDIMQVMEKMKGYVPFCDAVRDFELSRGSLQPNASVQYRTADTRLLLYAPQIDYVKNIGQVSPFFLVESEHIDKLLSLYAQGHLRIKQKNPNVLPRELASKSSKPEEEYATLSQAGKSLGLNQPRLFELFEKAQLEGYTIKTVQRSGTELYNLNDMRKVMKLE